MDLKTITEMSDALSAARIAGTPAQVDLRRVGSLEEAREVQQAAVAALARVPRGYAMAGTSAVTARALSCADPIVGPLFEEDTLENGSAFRLPYGTLGAGAQFVFGIGAPLRREAVSFPGVRDAVLSCHLGIQILGRRVPNSVPLNEWTATADFGLDVACVLGPRIENWDEPWMTEAEVRLLLNHNVVARGRGGDVFGNPLAAVVWLAETGGGCGTGLQAGDLVATGSCTGVSQLVPGQTVRASFGQVGEVELKLE